MNIKYSKRTKIVATVGPASQDSEILKRLILAGVNVFRLNFSHGSHQSHLQAVKTIKKLRRELNCPAAILQDLTGPKVRVGEIANEPLKVQPDDMVILDASLNKPATANRIGINYHNFAKDVFEGSRLLLADGDLELRVEKVDEPSVYCRVVIGGSLSSHKGVNFPTGSFNMPAFTEKDRQDLIFGLKNGIDLAALSFVRSPADLESVRAVFKDLNTSVPVIAKIEKHEALNHLEEIIQAADGIMVARGDLGVEIEIERVPGVQKRIITLANRAGKPVITATQMLRSMVDASKPTRAEATDVANAILDGSDAVMLSEETAVGKFPEAAVSTMIRIAQEVEKSYPYFNRQDSALEMEALNLTNSVAYAAVVLARNLKAKLILAVTRSGHTAMSIAKFRPDSLILALTPAEAVYYRLSLVWGVVPVKYPLTKNLNLLLEDALKIARDMGLIQPNENYVLTSGFPLGEPGSINQITAGTVPE